MDFDREAQAPAGAGSGGDCESSDGYEATLPLGPVSSPNRSVLGNAPIWLLLRRKRSKRCAGSVARLKPVWNGQRRRLICRSAPCPQFCFDGWAPAHYDESAGGR